MPSRRRKPKTKAFYEGLIRNALRKIFFQSEIRRNVFKKEKDADGFFQCYICGLSTPFEWQFQVEHVEPVVDPGEGFVNWQVFIDRLLFCPEDNLKLACRPCHKDKTDEENARRKRKPKRSK